LRFLLPRPGCCRPVRRPRRCKPAPTDPR